MLVIFHRCRHWVYFDRCLGQLLCFGQRTQNQQHWAYRYLYRPLWNKCLSRPASYHSGTLNLGWRRHRLQRPGLDRPQIWFGPIYSHVDL